MQTISGVPPSKQHAELECNPNLVSLDKYDSSTFSDAALYCKCLGRGVSPFNKNQCTNLENEMCLTNQLGQPGTCDNSNNNSLKCGNMPTEIKAFNSPDDMTKKFM